MGFFLWLYNARILHVNYRLWRFHKRICQREEGKFHLRKKTKIEIRGEREKKREGEGRKSPRLHLVRYRETFIFHKVKTSFSLVWERRYFLINITCSRMSTNAFPFETNEWGVFKGAPFTRSNQLGNSGDRGVVKSRREFLRRNALRRLGRRRHGERERERERCFLENSFTHFRSEKNVLPRSIKKKLIEISKYKNELKYEWNRDWCL